MMSELDVLLARLHHLEQYIDIQHNNSTDVTLQEQLNHIVQQLHIIIQSDESIGDFVAKYHNISDILYNHINHTSSDIKATYILNSTCDIESNESNLQSINELQQYIQQPLLQHHTLSDILQRIDRIEQQVDHDELYSTQQHDMVEYCVALYHQFVDVINRKLIHINYTLSELENNNDDTTNNTQSLTT